MDKPPREWSEAIKYINRVRIKSREDAAFYVEQGVLTEEEAAFLLEQDRLQASARRLDDAMQAYRSRRGRGRPRIEDDPYIQEILALAREMKNDNPLMTWRQVAESFPGLEERNLYRWLERCPK